MRKYIHFFIVPFLAACVAEMSEERRALIHSVNQKVTDIDRNHRIQIVEDDFHNGDSIYKIRGYFMDNTMIKLVGVLHTPRLDRDDYFYFENHTPIFSGHLLVRRDQQIAAEYKYYYSTSGRVEEALFWEDQYERGKQFPHESFRTWTPNQDSLRLSEEERLQFFLAKLDMEGFEIKHLNENLEANKSSQ